MQYWKARALAQDETSSSGAAQQEPTLHEQLDKATRSLDFYRRRIDALQKWQSKMRDPERTIVCDIIANGCTLEPAGNRYTTPQQEQQSLSHLHHCNMGEYLGSCKYGDENCPALEHAAVKTKMDTLAQPAQQEPVALDAIYAAWHGVGVDIAGGDWGRFVELLPPIYTTPPQEKNT